MTDRPPIALTPFLVPPNGPVFAEISRWPFADSYIGRLLRGDIPQRAKINNCRIWAYRDSDREIVGFGTIEVCTEYNRLTNNRPYPYIPLLAVNPSNEGRGYGTAIVKHLIGEAVLIVRRSRGAVHDALILDVYGGNKKAISLYKKCGFGQISGEIHDPNENKPYIIMATRISIATP